MVDGSSNLQVSDSSLLMGEDELRHLAHNLELSRLVAVAGKLRDEGHGIIQTYSPKVFIPLTHLCRDVCHYCI